VYVNGQSIGDDGEAGLFKVTYDANWPSVTGRGGVVPEDNLLYVTGSVVSVQGNTGVLTVADHTFIGWSFSRSGGPLTSPTFTITADTTLFAVWQYDVEDEFTVTYFGNGNSGGVTTRDPNWYVAGTVVTVLGQGSLVRDGYTFLGWSTSSTASVVTYVVGSTFVIYDDVWLYAVWSQNVYTVTYDPGLHGTFAPHVTGGLRYGDATPVAPIVTGEVGWTFTRWDPVPTATVTGTVVYVAQWAPLSPAPTVPPTSAPTVPPTSAPTSTPTPSVPATPVPSREGERERPVIVDKWAVVNLVLSIVGVVLAILVFVRALLLKKKDNKDNEQRNANDKRTVASNAQYGGQKREDSDAKKFTQRRTIWLIATVVLAIVGIIVFILTEDMSLPRGWVDRWTIVNAIILVAEIITVMFVFHNKKTETNKTDKNNTQTNYP